ncbi:MAG: hypothetical protein DRN96_01575 [Thermoproteota archaeon]|nr:MAG: hypothetical protein DRN96_01575 [Candidatus Korarchaeota archaeon]RLG56063.1 MAG: hypothetical protein DRN99_00785 [Candidatus Korarchaeota archaeon]
MYSSETKVRASLRRAIQRCEMALQGKIDISDVPTSRYLRLAGQAIQIGSPMLLRLVGELLPKVIRILLARVERSIAAASAALTPAGAIREGLKLASRMRIAEIVALAWRPLASVDGPLSAEVIAKLARAFLEQPDRRLAPPELQAPRPSTAEPSSMLFSDVVEAAREAAQQLAGREVDLSELASSWEELLSMLQALAHLQQKGEIAVEKKGRLLSVSLSPPERGAHVFWVDREEWGEDEES